MTTGELEDSLSAEDMLQGLFTDSTFTPYKRPVSPCPCPLDLHHSRHMPSRPRIKRCLRTIGMGSITDPGTLYVRLQSPVAESGGSAGAREQRLTRKAALRPV